MLEYKEYKGSKEYSEEDKSYWGKLLTYKNIEIKDLVLYEGNTEEELYNDFIEAIKIYEEDKCTD